MKKVVLITNIPSPYRVDLFYYLQKNSKEYEFYVIYTSESEDNRQWNVAADKLINSHILESKIIKVKGSLDSRYIHLPGNTGEILNKINPDVVIAWEYNLAAVQALIWCKLRGRKLIHLTDGTLYSERNITYVQKFLRKFICSFADSCIASSTKARDKLIYWGVKQQKIFISLLTVDVNGIDTSRIEPVPGRILYVGSMIKRKGLDLLLSSLANVDYDWSLHIVGNGTKEERKNLTQLAELKGLSDRIVWCGFKTGVDLVHEYGEATLFVLPTREDCYGLVLLEAYAAKRPIVSSKFADGAYDIILEGINGIIEDPFDSEKFGEAIEKVLKTESFLKNSQRNNIERFTFESVSKYYYEAIECALKGNSV